MPAHLKEWLASLKINTHDKVWRIGNPIPPLFYTVEKDISYLCELLREWPGELEELVINTARIDDRGAKMIAGKRNIDIEYLHR